MTAFSDALTRFSISTNSDSIFFRSFQKDVLTSGGGPKGNSVTHSDSIGKFQWEREITDES